MSEMPSILVVDDESSIRTLAQEILQRSGYTVLTADCGDQALAKFARHRHEIALVLTDVMMPRMTGIKLAERLLRLRPALPILFMSGTEPSAAGSCPLLVKPFTARQLLTQVSALIPASPRRKDVKTEFRVSRKRPIANRSPGQ